MRILFIDFTLPYLLKDSESPVGGWVVELNTWLQYLIGRGHQAGVLTWKGARAYVNSALDFDLLETYNPNKGIRILKYFYSYIPAILKESRNYKPDIIIQGCASLNTGIMAFIARRLCIPFVYRVQNDMDVDARYKTRLRRYEQLSFRFGIRRACAIICQNQYQYDRLKQLFPAKPIYVIHNPFNTDWILPKIILRGERKYVAWIGFFSHQKNLPLLLQTAGAVPDIAFRVAGIASSSLDERTGNALAELKGLKNVEFVGYVKRQNIMEFLSKAIALLSTSYYEGFSNTFLEAFAAGTPVIAPLRVDPDHIITRNELGLTTDSDEDLSQMVRQLKEMETDRYDVLSKRCQSYLLDHHAAETKTGELLEKLQPLLNQK